MDEAIVFEKVSGMVEQPLKQAPDWELGYFRSAKERAYRRTVTDIMLAGCIWYRVYADISSYFSRLGYYQPLLPKTSLYEMDK